MTPWAGLGLKPEHFDEALRCEAAGLWFEVHAENYMVAGGPRRSWLRAIRSRHPVSLHGVGLSLAADSEPDRDHLERLAALVSRADPVSVSEHLAWSTCRGAYLPDLLPFPRTHGALVRIAANIGRVQDRIGRRIAVENPSHYLRLERHEYDEIDFLAELARRSGCGLLLDVTNVHVSANNLGFSAARYLDAFPGPLVDEIHLAGYSNDPLLGESLLIDSHDAPIAECVWSLYRRLVARIGARPTLIERDDRLPSFEALLVEREVAAAVLAQATRPARAPATCDEPPVAGAFGPPIGASGSTIRARGSPAQLPDSPDRPFESAGLAHFERAFAITLLAPPGHAAPDEAIDALAAQPGFAVYRNTVMRGLILALRANYPSVARIVGDECFFSLAACFARFAPPAQPCLAGYGDGFADFLEAVAPAEHLPCLAGVARLDRLWTEAHLAADEPSLEAAALGTITAEQLGRTMLVPHAATRWAWFDRDPVHTIWRHHREDPPSGETGGFAPDRHAEGALIVRPRDSVASTALDAASCAFLDACAGSLPLADCAQAAFDTEPEADLAALLAGLCDTGAFTRLRRLPPNGCAST